MSLLSLLSKLSVKNVWRRGGNWGVFVIVWIIAAAIIGALESSQQVIFIVMDAGSGGLHSIFFSLHHDHALHFTHFGGPRKLIDGIPFFNPTRGNMKKYSRDCGWPRRP